MPDAELAALLRDPVVSIHVLYSGGEPAGFFELDGVANVYYVFRYPTGHKVLLLAAWQREADPVAEMVAYSCPAA